MSKMYARIGVLFAWNKKKIKEHHEHKKIHDVIKKKGLIDRESLVALWAKFMTRLKVERWQKQNKSADMIW
jgi:hypothetical protein